MIDLAVIYFQFFSMKCRKNQPKVSHYPKWIAISIFMIIPIRNILTTYYYIRIMKERKFLKLETANSVKFVLILSDLFCINLFSWLAVGKNFFLTPSIIDIAFKAFLLIWQSFENFDKNKINDSQLDKVMATIT